MRKVLIIALGVASFGAVSVGPASADLSVQTTNCTSKYEQKTVVEGRPPRPVMKWVLVQKICGGAIGGSNTTQPIQQQKLKKIN